MKIGDTADDIRTCPSVIEDGKDMRPSALKSLKVYKWNFRVVVYSDVGTQLPNDCVTEVLRL